MDFHQDLSIPAIEKLSFQLPHLRIPRTHHCDNMRQLAFKCSSDFQYILFCRDYAERIVANFEHQIKSEYYGGNRSVSI